MDYSKRVFGLDVFRALAILQVVLSHGGDISKSLFDSLPNFPWISGVEMFFVLSGFLIGGIIIKTIDRQNSFGLSDLMNFWKRRWFRTLPNYYLILSVNILLIYFGIVEGDLDHYSHRFWFFLQNFSFGFTDFFWESWSLSIEEWFYIFFPASVFVTLHFMEKRRAMLTAIILIILLPLLYRVYVADVKYDAFWAGTHISKIVLTRLDSIGYGLLAAYLKYYHFDGVYKYKNILALLGLVIVYTAIYFRGDPNGIFFRTVFFSLYSMGPMLFLFKADSIKNFRNKFFGKAITHISLISYSMYLLHFSVVASIIVSYVGLDTPIKQATGYTLYWGLTILMSSLLYYYFEKPITALRDKI